MLAQENPRLIYASNSGFGPADYEYLVASDRESAQVPPVLLCRCLITRGAVRYPWVPCADDELTPVQWSHLKLS